MFDPDKINLKVRILQKAVVFNTEGKFIALRRASTDFSRPNKWDLPGGWVEQGEDIDLSIDYKVETETHLEVEDLQVYYRESLYDPKIQMYTFFICYKATGISKDVVLSSEHSEYRWVTKEEFLKLESVDYLVRFVEGL